MGIDVGGRARVLVVEDDGGLRRMYQGILSAAGYEVIEAQDGEEGWEIARERRPDLLLLDIRLPKLDGYALMERIRADEALRDTPIVVLSSAGNPQDIRKGLDGGADEYTVKGLCPPKEIVAKIRAALSLRREGRRLAPYRLFLTEGRGDVTKLWRDIGLTTPHHCPQCAESLALELTPNPARSPGHWYAARFVCSQCGRAV